MVYCSQCRQPLPPGWRFCPDCNPAQAVGNRKEAVLWLLLGNFSQEHRRPQMAALFYRAALEADPENWEASFNLGCQAWQEGQVDRALSWWKTSLQANPDNYLAHFNLGTYFLYNRNLSAARYHLARVRRLKPHYLAARINLGTTYLLLGLAEAAREEYIYVLKQDPGHVGARRGLALISKVFKGVQS
ncbi:MAG: hypothetical protein PWP41_206 [Moorella sp. (in: firmicutes)]|nr:hypothetical protein [Moorella sp. (in: firmicutes)]